jgi:hypothetical protein
MILDEEEMVKKKEEKAKKEESTCRNRGSTTQTGVTNGKREDRISRATANRDGARCVRTLRKMLWWREECVCLQMQWMLD